MRELADHILDLAENSIRAGAKNLRIGLVEDEAAGTLTLEVADDGRGMTEEQAGNAAKPFVTTKTVGSVGLGLSLMRQTAEQSGGRLEIESSPGGGTVVRAIMIKDHIDRPPVGDLNATLMAIIGANPTLGMDVRIAMDGEDERFTAAR